MPPRKNYSTCCVTSHLRTASLTLTRFGQYFHFTTYFRRLCQHSVYIDLTSYNRLLFKSHQALSTDCARIREWATVVTPFNNLYSPSKWQTSVQQKRLNLTKNNHSIQGHTQGHTYTGGLETVNHSLSHSWNKYVTTRSRRDLSRYNRSVAVEGLYLEELCSYRMTYRAIKFRTICRLVPTCGCVRRTWPIG